MSERIKAEKREAQRRKATYGPRGGTVAGQVVRVRTARGYHGSAKRFVRIRKSTK